MNKFQSKITDEEININIFDIKSLEDIPSWSPLRHVKSYSDLLIAILDIETLGLNPATDKIIAIGILYKNKHIIFSGDDEFVLLIDFLKFLLNHKIDVLAGHNIWEFDIPFLAERLRQQGIVNPFNIFPYKYPKRIAKETLRGEIFIKSGITHKDFAIVDTIHLVQKHDAVTRRLTSYGLKQAVLQLGLRKEARLDIQDRVKEYYEKKDFKTIEEYLKYDLEDTGMLCNFLLPQYYYILEYLPEKRKFYGRLKPITIQDAVYSSTANIVEIIFEDYYQDQNLPLADEKKSYQGAHCECNPGLYNKCGKIDITSMYPFIMLLYRICSRKDTDKYMLSVLKYLTEQRLVLKKRSKDSDITPELRKEAELRQGALKILINSIYGFYGTGRYPFNDMSAAEMVTAYGRAIIGHMIDKIASLDGIVIEVDTDGVIYSSDNLEHIFEEVQKALPSGFKIDLEFADATVYAKAIKNYIIFFQDGSTRCKGEFRKRNIARYEKEFPIEYIKRYAVSESAAEEYYNEIKNNIKRGTIDLDFIRIKKRVGKAEKQFSHLGYIAGQNIIYYQGYSGKRNKNGKLKINNGLPASMPVVTGQYHTEYYLKELRTLKETIDTVVQGSCYNDKA